MVPKITISGVHGLGNTLPIVGVRQLNVRDLTSEITLYGKGKGIFTDAIIGPSKLTLSSSKDRLSWVSLS